MTYRCMFLKGGTKMGLRSLWVQKGVTIVLPITLQNADLLMTLADSSHIGRMFSGINVFVGLFVCLFFDMISSNLM